MSRAVLVDGAVRGLRVDVQSIVAEGARRHELSGAARGWYADGLVAAALLGAYLDDGERLTVQVQAESPRFAFTSDVNADGAIRARITPSDVQDSDRVEGVMFVLKSVVGREVYRGVTQVSHSSFAAMLQEHLKQSLQTICRVRVRDGVGSFVELMPDGGLVNLDQLADDVLEAMPGEVSSLRWQCACSEERVLDMLKSLGTAEVQSMIDEDGGAVVDCHYCTERVALSVEQLRSLL